MLSADVVVVNADKLIRNERGHSMCVKGCGWSLCWACAAVGECMPLCLIDAYQAAENREINSLAGSRMDGEGTQRHMPVTR
jgi:hypothetical protein